ncbi:MAG TPA: ankyrin repeat domain-containing protein [Terriglobia bacterium]
MWLISPLKVSAQSIPVRNAVTKALPMLQKSAAEFVAKRSCVSCHHNALTILTLDSARAHGFNIDETVLKAVEDKTFRELTGPGAADDAVQATTLNDPTPDDSYLLMAAHDAGLPRDLTTAAYAIRLARWQRDGHWITSDFRPPHSSSLFMTTATAVRAIRSYMPEELQGEREAVLGRARQWLFENHPISTEDAAFRLMGLVWSGAAREQLNAAQRDLLALQKTAGGWPQLPGYEADAYSTGEALVALHEAEVQTANPAFSKGLKFILSTQAPDGTWHVHTRMLSPADISPKYFATGFPYGKDEFLSYAGSSWAVMALLSTLPETRQNSGAVPAEGGANTPAWLRTAMFGTARELGSLLESGLDPNSKTKGGTTLLMASVLDPEKVQMLIARGVDVKARSASGHDALTIAAAYRGTSRSLQLVLDAGAEAQPAEGQRVRNTPLEFASMTGDLENVKLLLARGAKPSEKALSQSVTFGYPDVVRLLIAAGADVVGLKDGSGVNLLHWATITDRPALIPVLAEAHVPINEMDDNGFTPLMYAATIDFGDDDVLKALLKAGADKTIRNLEGRTPLAQAKYYKHSHLEAALR